MLTSIAGLLAEFQSKQVEILKAQSIVHAPTIGDMYEGLTRQMLARAMPASLGLRIVDGFAKGHDGTLSQQVDAMLVMGDKGQAIPQTSKFTWPIQDVLAVFEVKKSLHGNELTDSLRKMRTVSRLHRDFMRANPPNDVDLAASSRAFARLMGRFPTQEELEDL